MPSVDGPISGLIRTADGGDPAAASALFAALYQELHAIAQRELRAPAPELPLGDGVELLVERREEGRRGRRSPPSQCG